MGLLQPNGFHFWQTSYRQGPLLMKPYILILEDDPTLGRVVVKTTEQLKLAAFLDSDGNRYRDIIREQGLPKAILLDLHLPFAAGADLLQEFQSDEQLRNVPVLVLTADSLPYI
jgi:CheY-like chemotaxis protein